MGWWWSPVWGSQGMGSRKKKICSPIANWEAKVLESKMAACQHRPLLSCKGEGETLLLLCPCSEEPLVLLANDFCWWSWSRDVVEAPAFFSPNITGLWRCLVNTSTGLSYEIFALATFHWRQMKSDQAKLWDQVFGGFIYPKTEMRVRLKTKRLWHICWRCVSKKSSQFSEPD